MKTVDLSKTEGGVIMLSDGKIEIAYGGSANFVHEITHGAQYESGDIGFNSTGSPVG